MKPIFNTAKMAVYFLAFLFLMATFVDTLSAHNLTTKTPSAHNLTTKTPMEEFINKNAHSSTLEPTIAPEDKWNRSVTAYDMIIIYGLPQEENEVVMDKVADIGHKLGFEKFPLDHVVRAYRSQIPRYLFPKPIMVHMWNRTLVHKWAMAFNQRRLFKDHTEPWSVLVTLPNEQNIFKQTAEDWARKRKFPDIWFDETNTTVFYRKSDLSPTIYQIDDMNHMYHLLSDDFRYEVTWSPVTHKRKIDIYEYVTRY